MRIKYGSYSHETGEIELSVSRQVLETSAKTPYARQERWELRGQLLASSDLTMDAKVKQLATAYSENNKKLQLLLNSGKVSYLELDPANTLGGVRVTTPPQFPSNKGAAYVTFLPYVIVVEAIVPISVPETRIIAFKETISRSGGGPRRGMLETLTGPPVPQILKQQTIYRATQRGSMTTLFSNPSAPAPIWPSALVGAPEITSEGPDRWGSDFLNYKISWSYTYESGVPLIGTPHVWGIG